LHAQRFCLNLSSFRLASTGIALRGTSDVAALLAAADCKLAKLDLSCNELCGSRKDHTFSPANLITFSETLQTTNRSLAHLDLSYCDIGARSTKALMDALVENEMVHTVLLNMCNISELGATHIGTALPKLKGLKTLALQECNVGPMGCVVSE
jgi:hypothetical protein